MKIERIAGFVLIVFFNFLIFCSPQKKDIQEPSDDAVNKRSPVTYKLVAKDVIEIPIDSTTLNYSTYPIYYANDTCEFYVYGNEFRNSVDFYDLNRKELVKRISFERSGPSALLSTRIIHLKSLDSIYIYSQQNLKILLTNYEGKIIKTYSVPSQWMTNLYQKFTVIGDDAYFAYQERGDGRAQSGTKIMIKYNLSSGEVTPFGSYYPRQFAQYIWYNFLPYYTFGHNNNVVIRYGCLPEIYNYNIGTDTTTVIEMRSDFQDKEIVPDRVANTFQELDRDFEDFGQGKYLGVHYDPYNHVYYSMFLPGFSAFDIDGNKNSFLDRPVTIIIFNEQFEYCGEVELKRNVYNNNYMCTKKGLMIPMSHPKNPNVNEDKLQFQILALEESK